MNFKEIYKAPYRLECNYVWCSNGVMALTFEDIVPEYVQIKIVNAMNEDSKIYFKSAELKYNKTEVWIENKGVPSIHIRGWGYLTGFMNLNSQNAIFIQDSFAEWILSLIKNEKS